MVCFDPSMNIETMLHDIDSRLDSLMVSQQLDSSLQPQGQGKKPLNILTNSDMGSIEWEKNALRHDTDSLKRWHQFVITQNKTAVAPVSLYDPRHKSFFKNLIHKHKVNGNIWRRNNQYRRRTHESAFWPMARFIDGKQSLLGFGVFDMDVKFPSYPTFLDQDGTFSELYCHLLPAMQLSNLLETHCSSGIYHTVVCKGAGEFYRFPAKFVGPDNFQFTGEHYGPPIIPRSEKNPDDYDNVGGDDEASEEDNDLDYSYQPRSDSYWDDDTYLERPIRQKPKGSVDDSVVESQSEKDANSGVHTQDRDSEPVVDTEPDISLLPSEISDDALREEQQAYDDPESIPQAMDKSLFNDLAPSDCRLYRNDGEKYEIQGGYITALNMKAYFMAVLKSNPVRIAVDRKNRPHKTDKVNRVSIWVFLKAHALMLTWDTLIENNEPFIHRVYLSSSFPETVYFYPKDYRGGKIYKDVLATFLECLQKMPEYYVNDKPIQVFEEIAIRSKIRRLFLRTPVEGFDLNCTAHMMLCTIYQALVLNVVTERDERGDKAPDDELNIETEQVGIARFATLNTKRFFRSLLHKFDTDFRTLLQTNINAGKLICFDPKIAPPVISIDTVKLTIFDSIHTQSHIGFNHRAGFVQHREPRTLHSGVQKRARAGRPR